MPEANSNEDNEMPKLTLDDHEEMMKGRQKELYSLKRWVRPHHNRNGVHTAFLHADVDQDLFAEPPEPDELYDVGLKEDEVCRLNKALYGYRKAPTPCGVSWKV